MSWKRSSQFGNRLVSKSESLFFYTTESMQVWWNDIRSIVKKPTVVSDALAGLTVAAVALPLNLALAVASGLPASVGILSGALGGFIAGALGGSRWQVTGPAAALNVMVFAIVQKYGVAGAAAAALVTGVLSLGLSFFGMGKWISRVPEVVIAGFTTGVGLKLLDQQLPHLLGIDIGLSEILFSLHAPDWLHDVSWYEVLCGLFVVFFILTLKSFPRIPGALLGLSLATFVSSHLHWDLKRVGQLSTVIPSISFPDIPYSEWGPLLLLCVPLALLGAVESLLSARVIDRMESKAKPHHANLELLGQGIANLAVGLFSGMPVTGVVVRSTVNIQSGGKSRLAAMAHGVFLLLAFLYFTDLLAKIPISALAGLLCLIGFRLIEFSHLVHLLKSHRLEAVSFVIAAVGTLNDRLFLGLLAAIALVLVGRLIQNRLKSTEEYADNSEQPGLRAVIGGAKTGVLQGLAEKTKTDWRVQYPTSPFTGPWIIHVGESPWMHASSYVHPKATVIGRVVIERGVHIAAETSIRADEGTPFFVGPKTNLQDGVVLHALKEKYVQVRGKKWAIYIEEEVSVAHQALIHGPCYIGARTFVGFKAVVHDSVVGPGCFVGIGAVVVGVEVPAGRFVPHGVIVDTQEKANHLPPATDQHRHFNEDVVEVNLGLASAYQWHSINETKSKEKAWKISERDFSQESLFTVSI